MMGPLAAPQRVAMRTGELPPQATVRADRIRLKQVLTNLVSIAIKYNRDGGSLTLDVAPVDAGWQISLADTGIGITAAHLPHLFEPFNRLGHSHSAIAGVGIGLVLTRWLITHMGGTIDFQSIVETGTTVKVTLPTAE
jgi:signal transduction histidine kinase